MKKSCFIILSLMFILCSCNKESSPDFIQSTGNIVEEVRIVDDFEYVSLSDNIILDIIQDTCNWVKVKAGKNLLPEIITKVENGKIVISNENRFNWVRTYKEEIRVTLGVKKLKHIYYEGWGNITCLNTLITDSLFFETYTGSGHLEFDLDCHFSSFAIHTGTSDIAIKGKSDFANIYSFGLGPIEAQDFIVDVNAIHLKNLASAKINVRNDLNVTIESKGSIYYQGNPTKINTKITGTGKLIKL